MGLRRKSLFNKKEMTISVVINADTRIGYLNPTSTVGDFGGGSLQGVRSVDLLTEGLKNKLNFFSGYNLQCVLYIDKHEDISPELMKEIEAIVYSCGNNSKLIFKPHDRTQHKWNDRLYLEAFKLAEGDYVVHFDNDSNAYKKEGSDIVERYFKWLDEGYKYVCQPWDGFGDDMYWASTRFTICKSETAHNPLIESSVFTNPLMGKHNPCYEHATGILVGRDKILYPPREDDDYIIFCWASYFSGLLKHLNSLPYEEVKKYILDCGLVGTHDIISKPITDE